MAKRYSLSRLAASLEKCIELHFSGTYWVNAETIDVKPHAATGHCYLELIEKEPDSDRIKARMRAVVWASRYAYIQKRLAAEAERSFSSGLAILALVKVRFSPQYGLSLEIQDIDPAYTLGEAARRRKELAEKLQKEGLMERNKQIPLPHPIKTIALISSADAAGFGDFKEHLLCNSRGFPYSVVLYPAIMQGSAAEESVLDALKRIQQSIVPYDVAAIVRGGGAEVDLSAFDSYEIARAIALFPLPVLTGIGHQRDTSLCDMVAGRSLKTPTAVADFLVNYREEEHNALATLSSNFIRAARVAMERHTLSLHKRAQSLPTLLTAKLDSEKMRLASDRQRFAFACRHYTLTERQYLRSEAQHFAGALQRASDADRRMLDAYRLRLSLRLPEYTRQNAQRLSLTGESLGNALRRAITQRKQTLAETERVITLTDPLQTLQRGYAIVTRSGGGVVKDAALLKEGERISIRLAKGSAAASVLGATAPKD